MQIYFKYYMPYLKNKILKSSQKAQDSLQESLQVKVEESTEDSKPDQGINIKIEVKIENDVPNLKKKQPPLMNEKLLLKKKSTNSTKNIVKNFGRAMVTFTISKVAFPYLETRLKELDLDYKDFRNYLVERKENMDGISSLRALLLADETDDEMVIAIKEAFQYSAEIFVKYFSVNWIYHSKVGDKKNHLKARFKILRRIREPEYFTYFLI